MKKILITLFAAVLAIGMLVSIASPAMAASTTTVYEQYDVTGQTVPVTVDYHQWDAQTFTASSDHAVSSVDLYMGEVSGTITVSITATSQTGEPDTSQVLYSGSITSTTSTSPEWMNIPMTTTNGNLTNGKLYAIVVYVPLSDSTSHGYLYSGGDYSGGTSYNSPNGGTLWIPWSYSGIGDFFFKIIDSPTYYFSGFLSPLEHNGTYGLGRVVPIKWQLTDASGNFTNDLSAVTSLLVGPVGGTLVTPEASGKTVLRYDTTSNQYIFNWDTKGLDAGDYTISLSLDDGTPYTLPITLK